MSLPPMVSDPDYCWAQATTDGEPVPAHNFSEAVLDSRFPGGTYVRCSQCKGRRL